MAVRTLFDAGPATGDAVSVRSARSLSCTSCGLHRGATSPYMEPHGNFRRRIMVVGEAPGEREDRVGKPWQGKTGQLLRRKLGDVGVDLDEDCISLNAVNCRPVDDRTPTPHELACCRAKFVAPTILEHRPRVVLLMGGVATGSVLGPLHPDVNDAISKWRGWRIPVPEWGCYVCPTYHPSFVAREEAPEVDVTWANDLRAAVALADADPPTLPDLRRRVVILRDERSILDALAEARRARLFSHDYETTGLLPNLHEIVCVSFATSVERAYAFAFPVSDAVRRAWAGVLSDRRIGKVSHNLKFEAKWSREHFGVEDVEWVMDTMVATHVLDNRPGICALKLQGFLNFGIRPWDADIDPYLKSADGPHGANRIREFIASRGWDAALLYCGLDSLVALMLALKQMEALGL